MIKLPPPPLRMICQNRIYLYSHDFPNPNIIRILIWKPNSINYTRSQNFKFSVVIKGTEGPIFTALSFLNNIRIRSNF